jgi:hypothetical protein
MIYLIAFFSATEFQARVHNILYSALQTFTTFNDIMCSTKLKCYYLLICPYYWNCLVGYCHSFTIGDSIKSIIFIWFLALAE